MTTPLEAYLTGIVLSAISDREAGISPHLTTMHVTDDEGMILGEVELVDTTTRKVRASIHIHEHVDE